ncbi:MAG: response regulator, partial [Pseudomonadales bacterium]
MATLRTVIVDDEPLALVLLRSYLSSIAEIEIVAECKNGKEAIAAAMEFSPDLMFLDIQMPGINGFDVIKNLQADMMPLVIFATAYEHYALDAFNIHAVDYILKPIDQERVSRAVERALQRFERVEDDGQKSSIISALSDMATRAAGDSKSVDTEQNPKQNIVQE